ncbi:MAG TPA: type II toxin-antitoxin system prevent-host-death family antitoxin [Desulfatiglandales bacterium]|nr:type II toxin-antitoxin system prevent-host-death family antitoxin [Desulfatiglandales bacterium]
MIRVNITEIKNRLSHYLRLVKGGEEIEIVDRNTPLARVVGIGNTPDSKQGSPWVKEMYDLGIVLLPKKNKASSNFANIDEVISSGGNTCGVLDALLDERNKGR